MMPGLDGWQVAEQLLEDDRTSEIPIIFLTARAEFRDRARGLDIGGVDYVTKPFNPLELAPLVRELLDRIERGERDELRGEKLAALRRLMEIGVRRAQPREVGGDDRRAALAEEGAVREAEADAAEAGAEQVRAMLGAREPHADDRAGAAGRARAPGEVLAEVAADVEGGHPAVRSRRG